MNTIHSAHTLHLLGCDILHFGEALRAKLNCLTVKLRDKITPFFEERGYVVGATGNQIQYVIAHSLMSLMVLAYYGMSIFSVWYEGTNWLAYLLNIFLHIKLIASMYIDCKQVQERILKLHTNQWQKVCKHLGFLKFVGASYATSCGFFTICYIAMAIISRNFPTSATGFSIFLQTLLTISLLYVGAYDIASCIVNLFRIERMAVLR